MRCSISAVRIWRNAGFAAWPLTGLSALNRVASGVRVRDECPAGGHSLSCKVCRTPASCDWLCRIQIAMFAARTWMRLAETPPRAAFTWDPINFPTRARHVRIPSPRWDIGDSAALASNDGTIFDTADLPRSRSNCRRDKCSPSCAERGKIKPRGGGSREARPI